MNGYRLFGKRIGGAAAQARSTAGNIEEPGRKFVGRREMDSLLDAPKSWHQQRHASIQPVRVARNHQVTARRQSQIVEFVWRNQGFLQRLQIEYAVSIRQDRGSRAGPALFGLEPGRYHVRGFQV